MKLTLTAKIDTSSIPGIEDLDLKGVMAVQDLAEQKYPEGLKVISRVATDGGSPYRYVLEYKGYKFKFLSHWSVPAQINRDITTQQWIAFKEGIIYQLKRAYEYGNSFIDMDRLNKVS